MATILGNTAIVSLGISCQVAMQLEDNAGFLAEITGADYVRRGTPFDYLISDLASTSRMISAGRFYPDDDSHIVRRIKHPCWPEMGCFYWHETREAMSTGQSAAKFAHMGQTFFSLGTADRLIFIAANTQNNLVDVKRDTADLVDYAISDTAITELRRALDSRFDRYELYFVTYADRCSMDLPENVACTFVIEPDNSRVRGSAEQWKPVLSQIINGQ